MAFSSGSRRSLRHRRGLLSGHPPSLPTTTMVSSRRFPARHPRTKPSKRYLWNPNFRFFPQFSMCYGRLSCIILPPFWVCFWSWNYRSRSSTRRQWRRILQCSTMMEFMMRWSRRLAIQSLRMRLREQWVSFSAMFWWPLLWFFILISMKIFALVIGLINYYAKNLSSCGRKKELCVLVWLLIRNSMWILILAAILIMF